MDEALCQNRQVQLGWAHQRLASVSFCEEEIEINAEYFNALTGAAAVRGHHHCVDSRVLDDVLPVDGVSVTQEFVLVNVHASTQDLCGQMVNGQ